MTRARGRINRRASYKPNDPALLDCKGDWRKGEHVTVIASLASGYVKIARAGSDEEWHVHKSRLLPYRTE